MRSSAAANSARIRWPPSSGSGSRGRRSPDRLERVIEQAGNNQVMRLERRLGALVAIIGVEPLLGFLGTITGLIRAFMSWERAGRR